MGLEFYNNRKREKFMKIVILDGYAANPGDLDYHLLEKLGEVVVYPRTSDAEKVERAKDADIILLNKVQIDAETLAQLPKLKYIGIQATGFNVVDIEAARKQGIIVTNIPAYSTDSVAQMTFALILASSQPTTPTISSTSICRQASTIHSLASRPSPMPWT
jgi:glycerate dehydrogenase